MIKPSADQYYRWKSLDIESLSNPVKIYYKSSKLLKTTRMKEHDYEILDNTE